MTDNLPDCMVPTDASSAPTKPCSGLSEVLDKLARAEKVIEAALLVVKQGVADIYSDTLLRNALAEYDRPTPEKNGTER